MLKVISYFTGFSWKIMLLMAFIMPVQYSYSKENLENEYVFRQLTVKDGLSDNRVRNIGAANDGRICFRTNTMLNIYDGSSFRYLRFDSREVIYTGYTGYFDMQFDQDGRLWLKTVDDLWFLNMYSERFCYDLSSFFEELGVEFPVSNINTDSTGNLWLFSSSGDLYCYSSKTGKLQAVTNAAEDPSAVPLRILPAGKKVWMICKDLSLRCWDLDSGKFILTQKSFLLERPETVERIDMDITGSGDICVMTNSSLSVFYRNSGEIARTSIFLAGSDQFSCMDIDSDDRIWLGSSKSGLRLIDSKTLSIRHFECLATTSGRKISHNTDISDIFIDANGIIWIAVANEGILLYHKNMARIGLIDHTVSSGKGYDWNVKSIEEDTDGNILFATINGLLKYNPRTGIASRAYPVLKNELCIALFRDSHDRIWVGTFQNGVYCINGNSVKHYRYKENYPIYVSYKDLKPYYNSVRTFFEDSDGNIWVSVYGGIGKINALTGQIDLLSDRFPQIGHMKMIRTICALDEETLLVTAENGLFCYNTKKDSLYYDPSSRMFMDRITKHNSTVIDSRGLIWFGTHEGLFIWSSRTDSLYQFGLEDGFPENVQGIVEDDNGDVWLSSPNTVSKVSVKESADTMDFYSMHYGTVNGVQDGSFYEHSALKASDGKIYFGGTHGVNAINPTAFPIEPMPLHPYFSDFRLFNSTVVSGKEYNGRTILEQPLSKTEEIRLDHGENFVTFSFSGLNYVNPTQTWYRYRLDGFDSDYTEIKPSDGIGTVTYSFLNPGSYRFVVEASSDNRNWSEPITMGITIMPPWWNTAVARIIYVILTLLFLYLAVRAVYRKSLDKITRLHDLEKKKHAEELVRFKLKFFTNISHELRTPLSLIITPLDSVIGRTTDVHDRKLLEIIRKNAHELLDMVNTLLDFRKLETDNEQMHYSNTDMVDYVSSVCDSFSLLAQAQKIDLGFSSSLGHLEMSVDKEKIGKILKNLLSNALKFTGQGGSVHVSVECDDTSECRTMVLKVSDTGSGIRKEDIDKIFLRFYQAGKGEDERIAGSGIGLHIVKEYVRLHNGTVNVESSEGQGSTFEVRIPVISFEVGTIDGSGTDRDDTGVIQVENKHDSLHTLLIVEDNREFASYLKDELSGLYRIYLAADGKEGIAVAKKEEIDLIITDVMMPVIDGMEMCRILKTDIDTSHIPIIMLTAKNADESRISGYGAGADEFLSKPFNMDILLLRIRYLLDMKERRIEYFSREIKVNPSKLDVPSLDEALIGKALKCVEENMDNPDFSVEMLSGYVGMHRMNLYRKFQSILGQTPSVFIRSIRLKRAAQLLSDSGLNVTEIAYMTGFSSLKYFDRYFKEEFGVTPTQYASGIRNKAKKELQNT